MLLSEQIRMVRDEEVLYTSGALDDTGGPSWVTKATKQITLSSTKIVYVKFTTAFVSGDSAFRAHGRVLLDSVPLLSAGYVGNGESVTRDIFLVLSAGTYQFDFQGCNTGSAGTWRLTDIKIATLNFPDKQRNSWDSGSVSCPTGSTTTVLNQNFTVPATRKLAVGQVKKYVCIIKVCAIGERRQSFMKNPGEANETGRLSWRILLDDTEQSWTERKEDRGGSDSNDSYGRGAYGCLVKVLDPDTTYNLKINVYNDYGSTLNNQVTVDIILCPWILADVDYEPVTLDFPQGSTLYVTLEPLNQDPTKYARVGKQRFVSFGDATDYYSSQNGTGILAFDYTFETVEVVNSILHVKGYGGCVSIIGVDVR